VPRTTPDLDYILNAHNFQKIQDCLSAASDMAMLIVDYHGVPVTRHSRCSDYCALVRSDERLNDLCRKCDARGGLEAARISSPYIYRCHMGILDLAVPIILDGVYAGAILAGQVVLASDEETEGLEKIVESCKYPLASDFLRDLDERKKLLPVMARDRVQVIANMLFQINNYIVEEAMLKIALNESLDDAEKIGKNAGEREKAARNNPIVRPALEYIAGHYDERITIDDMASLCNISSSYFSKLFNRITGETFTNYVNTLRVERARELLDEGDTPITNIAFDLGFEDISYFDKVFKRITGVTPSSYKSGRRA
jgi:ligand-binding sensor protein/AraC-like DNA-binding protein